MKAFSQENAKCYQSDLIHHLIREQDLLKSQGEKCRNSKWKIHSQKPAFLTHTSAPWGFGASSQVSGQWVHGRRGQTPWSPSWLSERPLEVISSCAKLTFNWRRELWSVAPSPSENFAQPPAGEGAEGRWRFLFFCQTRYLQLDPEWTKSSNCMAGRVCFPNNGG